MIYHGSPYEMQTEIQGERQRMTTAEKRLWGAAGLRPPQFLFCCAHPLPGVPLTSLFDICAWTCGTALNLLEYGHV